MLCPNQLTRAGGPFGQTFRRVLRLNRPAVPDRLHVLTNARHFSAGGGPETPNFDMTTLYDTKVPNKMTKYYEGDDFDFNSYPDFLKEEQEEFCLIGEFW